ncbi:MAG: hypothetical protein RL662_772 [Bacteroidota bacterium]|jgi:ABC-type lipoprotein export system ATPase subunit
MNQIILDNVLPSIFSTESTIKSDIWLQNVNFEVGNYYLIQANSGTGKSSLCSYIYGYRDDYLGSLLFDNTNIRRLKTKDWDRIRSTQLSMLFQELFLFPELTAWENIQLKNNLTGYKSDDQINVMFDKLGIADKKHAMTAKMSWGQRQRVAVIRSLCQPFRFIILDEPISHLDDENASIMADLIQSEALQQGAGIIVTSIGKHLPLSYTQMQAL